DSSYIFSLVHSDGTILYSNRPYVIGNSIDATYPRSGLGTLLFTNIFCRMHYETPYADCFRYSKQIIPITGTWIQATFMGETAAYMITRPDDVAAIDLDVIQIAEKNEMTEIVRKAVSYQHAQSGEETGRYQYSGGKAGSWRLHWTGICLPIR
ncbi:MAG: hypothetical protein MJ014_05090, partial [Methanocorpusculum sp.]|nr:hypothetical protein [Methanocorpusculum sp.]